MTANQKRIRNARAALRAYIGFRCYSDLDETDLTDLVTDLYHLAQAENVDVEFVARNALEHFKAELIADPSDRTIPNFGDGKAQVRGNEDVKEK